MPTAPRTPRHRAFIGSLAFAAPIALHIVGCASPSAPARADTAQAPASPALASVTRAPLTLADFTAPLLEAAGAEVLEELALERLVNAQLAERDLALPPDAREQELARLLDAVDADTGLATDDAARLLDLYRARQGLGPDRFERRLRTTAALRLLVGPQPVTDAEVDLALTIRTGPRVVIRLLQARDRATIDRARADLLAAPDRPQRFAQLAESASIHPSSASGGRLEPLSLADPAFPLALRNALTPLNPGDLTQVVDADGLYHLALLERVLPASTATPPPRDAVREQLARYKQRLEMDRLARSLLDAADIAPFHRALDWSWSTRTAAN